MRLSINLILLLCSYAVYAQANGIRLTMKDFYEGFEENDSLIVHLKIGQQSIDSQTWSENYADVEFCNIKEGIYTLYIVNKEGYNTSYEGLTVHHDSITSVMISPWYFSIDCLDENCSNCTYQRIEFVFNSGYTTNWFKGNELAGYGLSNSFGVVFWQTKKSNFNLGTRIGGYYDFYSIDSNVTRVFTEPEKVRYSNLGLDLGLHLRWSAFDMKEYYSNGFFIETGAIYKFPVATRLASTLGDEKHSLRKIHQYKDVRLFLKAGYHPVSLRLEYRPIDFIDSPFPETPKWLVGLSFTWED
jgi:hypothetical protein